MLLITQLLRRLAVGVGAIYICAAFAQNHVAPANPANPAAAGPAITYHSAITGYRPAQDTGVSPDRQWVAANEAVAGMEGMENMPDMDHARHAKTPASTTPAMKTMPMDHRQHSMSHDHSSMPAPSSHAETPMSHDGMSGSMEHGEHVMPKGQ